ncbi:zinc finger domain-containing protein [Streptomyces sp. NBC_01220]|uniref:zinc finger domain-containing protein n=1 Tax=Streptomyces sp. NBC_01220 TaxID=2903781 RepID=UPI003D80AB43
MRRNPRAVFPAPPLRVPCPSCGVVAGAPCLSDEGDPLSRRYAHRSRGAAFRAWTPEDPWAADSGIPE